MGETQEINEDMMKDIDDTQYDIGDTVRLKSGGTLMTIKEVNMETYVCRWFDKDHQLNSSEFHKYEIYDDISYQIIDNSNPQNNFVQKALTFDINISEDEIPF